MELRGSQTQILKSSNRTRQSKAHTNQCTPTPLEGKEASAEQSVESLDAKPQPSMATPTEEDTRPKVLIRGQWRKVPDGYPADASGQLEHDQLFINDLSKQLTAELRAACQFNPKPGAKPKFSSTKTDLIYKCIFPRPFGAPKVERIRLLLYWPHTSALVAYNGGTSVGHGPVRTLFLQLHFVSGAGTLDVGHGPVRTLFLGLILCLVPMTPCETMLYWPHTSALGTYNGGTSVGHGPVRTLFLERDFVSSAGTRDVGHGPIRTLFLGLILCLVPMTLFETMLYWPSPN